MGEIALAIAYTSRRRAKEPKREDQTDETQKTVKGVTYEDYIKRRFGA